MTTSDPEILDRSWRLWASIAVISVLVFSVVFGFIVLPVVQGYGAGIDPFTAICRAIGIQPGAPPTPQPRSEAKAQPTTQVAWSADLMRTLSPAGAAGTADAGAAVAQGCAACHGDRGVSIDAQQFPNLAGQSALAIYKQLHDYKSGSRAHPIMTGMAQALADDDVVNVARFFSSSTALALDPTSVPSTLTEVKRLVERGDPARGIPACNACHGHNAGGPIETPTLSRQSAAYIAAQLNAFRAGDRRNDIFGRMRGIAAKLTDREIDALARFYSSTSAY